MIHLTPEVRHLSWLKCCKNPASKQPQSVPHPEVTRNTRLGKPSLAGQTALSARLAAVFEVTLTCLGEAICDKRHPQTSLVVCKLLSAAEMASVPTLQKKSLKEGGKSHSELIKISECNCILHFVLDRGSSKMTHTNRHYHAWMTSTKQLHRLIFIALSFSLPWQGWLALKN